MSPQFTYLTISLTNFENRILVHMKFCTGEYVCFVVCTLFSAGVEFLALARAPSDAQSALALVIETSLNCSAHAATPPTSHL